MSDTDSPIDKPPVRRWSFGAIAPGQAPTGLMILILCLAAGIFSLFLAIDGLRATSDDAQVTSDDDAQSTLQTLILSAVGALAFLGGGGFLGLTFLRAGLEEESLVVDSHLFTIEHTILSRKRQEKYLRRYVSELRIAEDVPEEIPEDQKGGFNPVNGGSLVFEYGGQSVYFGPQVIRAKAENTLQEILSIAPELAEPKPIVTAQDDAPRDWESFPGAVSPLVSRYQLSNDGRTTSVTIPARSSTYAQTFTTVWLTGWWVSIAMVAYFLWRAAVGQGVNNATPQGPQEIKMTIAFASLWLAVAIPAGLFIGFTLVWGQWGRQIIEIDETLIRIRNVCPAWRSTRTINRSRTTPIELRHVTGYFAKAQLKMQRQDSFLRGGWLECKEGYKKYYFGAGLTRRETVNLLTRLHAIDPPLVSLPDQ